MIPRIIHYCWFGENPLPELAKKCITSWKKFLPDFEIKEWNESNYDVQKNKYIAQAYKAKKYAFVSDYARFDILYKYGGIYFDTDVEVIKDLYPIIEKGAFIGIEKGTSLLLNAGLGIASPAASAIYKIILDSYKDEEFVNTDGTLNQKTVVTRVSDIFKMYGFVEKDCIQYIKETIIYPSEYFCPKNLLTGQLKITENTYTIHHYDGSWVSDENRLMTFLSQTTRRVFGNGRTSNRIIKFHQAIILRTYSIVKRIRKIGFLNLMKYYVKKYIQKK